MSKAPIEIYLQYDPDGETTWCEDRINNDDIAYVLKSRADASERELAALKERNNRLMENFAYWDSDTEYTCIHCGKFDSHQSGIVHDPDCPMLPEPPEAENE